jgi:2-polyprenyl-3-methyl-5-hydroxy-6-metoxy-1,4-benzoquinol methylase
VSDNSTPSTEGSDYADRLLTLETARWKKLLDVQRPYRWNLNRLKLGRTLDVGCGIGRNLLNLDPSSVGVDHNATSVEVARKRGVTAFTGEEFLAGPHAKPGAFDSILLAHVVEHMPIDDARTVVAQYLPYLKRGGRVMFICPQEKGYTTDSTHVSFTDAAALQGLSRSLGLTVAKSYSFPFPRIAGKLFAYNEFCVLAVKNS